MLLICKQLTAAAGSGRALCVYLGEAFRLGSAPPVAVVWSQPQVMFSHLPGCSEMAEEASKAPPPTKPPPYSTPPPTYPSLSVCVMKATLAVSRNYLKWHRGEKWGEVNEPYVHNRHFPNE